MPSISLVSKAALVLDTTRIFSSFGKSSTMRMRAYEGSFARSSQQEDDEYAAHKEVAAGVQALLQLVALMAFEGPIDAIAAAVALK